MRLFTIFSRISVPVHILIRHLQQRNSLYNYTKKEGSYKIITRVTKRKSTNWKNNFCKKHNSIGNIFNFIKKTSQKSSDRNHLFKIWTNVEPNWQ